MDTLVEKLSELGVAELWPVTTSRSVVASDEPSASRREHWHRIAIEAARQCGRATLLLIQEGRSLSGALEALGARQLTGTRSLRLAASLSEEATALAETLSRQPLGDVAVFIGPEGDFDPAELQELKTAGVLPVSLGPTVLRVETAAMVAAAAIVLWGDACAGRSRPPVDGENHAQKDEGKEGRSCPHASP
jgi:16S rRNA (uracil1498-N3)-methyltransferase